MEKLGDERDYIDFMTDMGFSTNLLEAITLAISKPEWRDIPLRTLIGLWMEKNELDEVISPYNFGVVIGELYCCLVFAKENWLNLLPDINFDKIDNSFGIKTANWIYTTKQAPKLKDIVRRMRNAVSHSNFKIQLSDNKEYPALFDEAYITFEDLNPKNEDDYFRITLQVKQLKVFYTKYRNIIFEAIINQRKDNK